MPKVTFSSDLQRYTNGIGQIEVAAGRYQELVTELCQRFPAITADIIEKYAIAIDGVIIQTPLLERFKSDSELMFITKIAGG